MDADKDNRSSKKEEKDKLREDNGNKATTTTTTISNKRDQRGKNKKDTDSDIDLTPKKPMRPKFRFSLDEDNVQRILDRRRWGRYSSSRQRKDGGGGDGLEGDCAGGGGFGKVCRQPKPRQDLLYIPKEMLVMSLDEKQRASQSTRASEYQNPERWVLPKKKTISPEANLTNEKLSIARRIAREKITSRATKCLSSANQELAQIGPLRGGAAPKHDPQLAGLLCRN